jgi:hypothetical protein
VIGRRKAEVRRASKKKGKMRWGSIRGKRWKVLSNRRRHSRISVWREHKRHVQKKSKTFLPSTAFVAMAFDGEPSESRIFRSIKRACDRLEIEVRRVDEVAGAHLVVETIRQMIEDAEFLIFELSKERPNVYYELGYAHGVGNDPSDIVILARKGTNVHFDVSGLRVRFYQSLKQLEKITLSELRNLTKEG